MSATPQVGVSRSNTETLEVPTIGNHSTVTASGTHTNSSTRAPSPAPSKSGSFRADPLTHKGSTHHSAIDIEGYFSGPYLLERHSKLPFFLRLRGSVAPRLLVPLLFVTGWSTAVTCIYKFVYDISVNSLLLTVLGFVIGLAISFRTSSAYERWTEGRKYWAEIFRASRDLSRHIWIHVKERHTSDPELGKADLLAKVTSINLIVAFAVSLKHKLQFEPYADHDDLEHLVSHLKTYAGEAVDPNKNVLKKKSAFKRCGEHLDVSFAQSNPRKAIKRSKTNLGNLPLEILMYLNSYLQGIHEEGTLVDGSAWGACLTNIQQLNNALTGCERVLNTPLPIAYSIAISQITWIYVMFLPFQLVASLGWVTIPGCIISAYVILALASIGREIENPFGSDTNDLPLASFCTQIAQELDVICSRPQFKMHDFIKHEKNTPIFNQPYDYWTTRTTHEIRERLSIKATSAKLAENPIESEKGFTTGSLSSV